MNHQFTLTIIIFITILVTSAGQIEVHAPICALLTNCLVELKAEEVTNMRACVFPCLITGKCVGTHTKANHPGCS